MTDTAAPYADDEIVVVALTEADWAAVRAIHAAGIETGHVTFETEPPSWQRFDQTRLTDHRHVAVDRQGRVLGWTAASAVSDRRVYAGVVEHALYVAPDARGRGVGRRLLEALVQSTEEAGIWTIQSGIFPENAPSLAVHRSAGFRPVGTRGRIGRMTYGAMEGQWRDVVLVERRSERVWV